MSSTLHKKLLTWFDESKRDLPWRKTKDPYAVWVSEIMLQQTQVATVIPFYERWMQRFPTVESLAKADEQEVLSHWQGLGYYRRCRMLQAGARHVLEHGTPASLDDWLAVPGIGRYTAGAISSIAQGHANPIVDGNVERVFARLTASESSGRELHRAAWEWAKQALDHARPGDWNQALMELGACVCKPVNPQCDVCPLKKDCKGFKTHMQNNLPVAEKQRETIKLCETVWVPFHKGSFGLLQAPKGEWWQGMWLFPRSDKEDKLSELAGKGNLEHAGRFKYSVTHHRIQAEAFLHRSLSRSKKLEWLTPRQLETVPMPAPQRKALKLAMLRLNSPALMPEEAASR